jgi:hypothetical protein
MLRAMRSRDTSREAREVQQALLRAMGPGRRLELAFEMCENARELAVAGIRSRDRTLTQAEARRILLRRILGDGLFDAALGLRGGD